MEIEALLTLAFSFLLFGTKVFALVDCAVRPAADFERIETLAKQGWLVILGIGLAAHIIRWHPLSLLNLLGTVAALVYLAQLRGSRH
jgi:hypothetical protein